MFSLLINESFAINKGTKIGQWEILSLQNETKYAPLNCPREFLEKGGRAHQNISTFDARQHIAAKLERLLSLKNNSLADENLAGIHDKQSKQIFINSLRCCLITCRVAGTIESEHLFIQQLINLIQSSSHNF